MAGETGELAFVATLKDQASAAARTARKTLDSVGGATKPITTEVKVDDSATAKLEAISAKAKTVGKNLTSAGSTLTKGLTVPLVGLAAVSLKASTDFNADMANIGSLIPGNTKRLDEFKGAVQDMSIELGGSTKDLSAGLYQTLSAFGDNADTVKILKVNAMAATAGVAETKDAINLTSAVTKAWGDTSAEAVQKAADLALMTVRLGQTTFPELAGSIGSVTPLAKALNVSQEELFATMATFTGVTGGASEVSTQLRGALQSLMAPTTDAAKAIKKAGYESGAALVKQEGLAGAVTFLTNEAKRSGKPLQNYIGSIEGQTIALGLAGPQADDYKGKLKQMGNVAGTTAEAFKAQTKGVNKTGFALNQAKARAVVMAQKLGDALAPAIGDALKAAEPFVAKIEEWADKFAKASPETQRLIVKIGLLLAAVGPTLVVVGKLTTAIGSIGGGVAKGIRGLQTLQTNMSKTSAKATALKAGVRLAAGAAGLGLLADGAQRANGKLKTLETVGGGAMLGFAVGGPIGGAIGAGAGALLTMWQQTGRATTKFSDGQTPAKNYASSLDEVSGAATKVTRQMALAAFQQSEYVDDAGNVHPLTEALGRLGINMRDLIDASLGVKGANKRVEDSFASVSAEVQKRINQGRPYEDLINDLGIVQNALPQVTGDIKASTEAWHRDKEAVKTWGQALKGIPKSVQVKLKSEGFDVSLTQLRKISAQAKLTPKQVKTTMVALGFAKATDSIQKVNTKLAGVGQKPADLQPFTNGLVNGLTNAKTKAGESASGVNTKLATVGQKPANLQPFHGGLVNDLTKVTASARDRAEATASAMKAPIEAARPRLDAFSQAFFDQYGALPPMARDTAGNIVTSMEQVSTARADLSGFRSSISSGLSGVASSAGSQGTSIGSSIAAGVTAGLSSAGALGNAISAAYSLVSQAVSAGRNAAQAKSPSRVMMRLGRDMADGLSLGIEDRRRQRAARAAGSLIARIVAKITQGDPRSKIREIADAAAKAYGAKSTDEIKSTTDRLRRHLRDRVATLRRGMRDELGALRAGRLKGAKLDRRLAAARETADRRIDAARESSAKRTEDATKALGRRFASRSRAFARSLKDETRSLVDFAKRRSDVADRLDKAQAKLKAAVTRSTDYAKSIREGIIAFADVTTTDPVNDAPVTAGFIAKDLKTKLAAVRKFESDLATLRRRKVSAGIIRDIEEQGVEGGGEAASALARATRAQLDGINATQTALEGVAKRTGDTAAREWYGTGIKAAEGVVRGIKARLRAVDAVGRLLARRLRRAVQDALSIRSPSRALAEDGRQIPAGLAAGIVAQTRQAEIAAADMANRVRAAATPTLGALAASAKATSLGSLTTRSTTVVTIRHEIRSPDGSVDRYTAEQIADIIARSPQSAKRIETALASARRRAAGNRFGAK